MRKIITEDNVPLTKLSQRTKKTFSLSLSLLHFSRRPWRLNSSFIEIDTSSTSEFFPQKAWMHLEFDFFSGCDSAKLFSSLGRSPRRFAPRRFFTRRKSRRATRSHDGRYLSIEYHVNGMRISCLGDCSITRAEIFQTEASKSPVVERTFSFLPSSRTNRSPSRYFRVKITVAFQRRKSFRDNRAPP